MWSNENHDKHYKQLEKLCKGQGQLFKYRSRKLEGATEITWKQKYI